MIIENAGERAEQEEAERHLDAATAGERAAQEEAESAAAGTGTDRQPGGADEAATGNTHAHACNELRTCVPA